MFTFRGFHELAELLDLQEPPDAAELALLGARHLSNGVNHNARAFLLDLFLGGLRCLLWEALKRGTELLEFNV